MREKRSPFLRVHDTSTTHIQHRNESVPASPQNIAKNLSGRVLFKIGMPVSDVAVDNGAGMQFFNFLCLLGNCRSLDWFSLIVRHDKGIECLDIVFHVCDGHGESISRVAGLFVRGSE